MAMFILNECISEMQYYVHLFKSVKSDALFFFASEVKSIIKINDIFSSFRKH